MGIHFEQKGLMHSYKSIVHKRLANVQNLVFFSRLPLNVVELMKETFVVLVACIEIDNKQKVCQLPSPLKAASQKSICLSH